MRTDSPHSATTQFSNMFLTGTILLAQIDYKGLLDYGLKAFLGGGIWLAYKLVADYIDRKQKNKPPYHEPNE